MRRLIPAIIIWACFLLLYSCQRFEQEYFHGHLKYTINDTIVVDFAAHPHLSWSQETEINPDYLNQTYQTGRLSMGCDQFDTSNFGGGMLIYKSEIHPHAQYSFPGYSPGPTGASFAFTIFHPQVGGFYIAQYSQIGVYFNEFNQNHINGYYYGDFYKPADSTTVYVTCDFDFTP
jgi:hypothetical protein